MKGLLGRSSEGQRVRSRLLLPPFHGLEPKLSLRYSSHGGNGFVGVRTSALATTATLVISLPAVVSAA